MPKLNAALVCLFAGSFVAGCGSLGKTIEDQVQQSQYCAVIQSIEYREGWALPEDFLNARVGKVYGSEPCKVETLAFESRFVQACRLVEIIERESLAKESTGFVGAVKKLNESLGNVVTQVETAALIQADEKCSDQGDTNGAARLQQKIAECWLTRFQTDQKKLRDSVAAVKMAAIEARNAANLLLAESAERQLEVEAWYRATIGSMAALLSSLSDADRALADLSRTYVPRYAAHHAVDAVHRALRPVDQALERADGKAYGAVSLGFFAANQSVRDKLVPPVREYIFERIEKLDSKAAGNNPSGTAAAKDSASWSFALSAMQHSCARLEKGQGSTLMSNLIDAVIIDAGRKAIGAESINMVRGVVQARSATLQTPQLLIALASEDRGILGIRGDDILPGYCTPGSASAKVETSDVSTDTECRTAEPAGLTMKAVVESPLGQKAQDSTVSDMCTAPSKVEEIPPQSAFARYVEREWDARALLSRKAMYRAVAGGAALSEVLSNTSLAPVDEQDVQQLAESSVARDIDLQWQLSDQPGSQAAFSGSESKAPPPQSKSAIEANLEQAAAAIASLAKLAAEPMRLPPSINIGLQPPSFCAEPALQSLTPYCVAEGASYRLRLQPGVFDTSRWQVRGHDNLAALDSIRAALAQYAARSNAQLRVGVTGYASDAPAAGLCSEKSLASFDSPLAAINARMVRQAERALEYQTAQHRLFRLPVCNSSAVEEGNRLLGAQRAAWVANALEKNMASIVIESLDTRGSSGALQDPQQRDRKEDRGVEIIISPSYLAPTRPANLVAQ